MWGLLPRMSLEPPAGYVEFVARHLEPLREDTARVIGDEHDADRLYPDVLTDVASRWGLLETVRRGLNRPDVADAYLRRAFARRTQLWQHGQDWGPDDGQSTVDFWVMSGDEPPPPLHLSSTAVRLAPQLPSTVRMSAAPIAEAAIAWWHAYEARRVHRWLLVVAVLAAIAILLVRLQQSRIAGAASVGLTVPLGWLPGSGSGPRCWRARAAGWRDRVAGWRDRVAGRHGASR